MDLYLDDNATDRVLLRLLRAAGHTVVIPADLGTTGENDPVHFLKAIQANRLLVTHDHDDFDELHALVIGSGGHHPGVLVIRRDNDPTRDLKPPGIVRAIHNLEAAGVPIADLVHVLNQWR
jgi:predicted nuclease of predicted toxin-antitoxin system